MQRGAQVLPTDVLDVKATAIFAWNNSRPPALWNRADAPAVDEKLTIHHSCIYTYSILYGYPRISATLRCLQGVENVSADVHVDKEQPAARASATVHGVTHVTVTYTLIHSTLTA